MTPMSQADHPYTKVMFGVIAREFKPPSRRTLGKDMDKLMERARTKIINLLFHQKWVATTADSWSAHNRAFIAMTRHYINRDSLQRQHVTLACKEMKVNTKYKCIIEK